MQQTYCIEADQRSKEGQDLQKLRMSGKVPAILYGNGVENKLLTVSYSQLEKIYSQAGESSLVDVVIESQAPLKTLIQDVQRDVRTGRFVHVDFHQVSMTTKLTANIPLHYVGEAKAVKELGGIFVKNISEVEVRCLPSDLVHQIEVDISRLATFEDFIRLKDITLPSGIEIHGNVETIIALVSAPISEAELQKLSEKPVEDVTTVKVEEKKKKDDE